MSHWRKKARHYFWINVSSKIETSQYYKEFRPVSFCTVSQLNELNPSVSLKTTSNKLNCFEYEFDRTNKAVLMDKKQLKIENSKVSFFCHLRSWITQFQWRISLFHWYFPFRGMAPVDLVFFEKLKRFVLNTAFKNESSLRLYTLEPATREFDKRARLNFG